MILESSAPHCGFFGGVKNHHPFPPQLAQFKPIYSNTSFLQALHFFKHSMNSTNSIPELLAPAGSLEKLKIAVRYGADAVYLGGGRYSLRAAADNFTEVELREGLRFAHQHGVKCYVVLNAFLHDSDLADLPEYLKFLEECQVDAVIVSDLGVIRTVLQTTAIPVHLSTQASCLSVESARLWQALGVRRVILGREVSLRQASQIREATQLEVELFIHGSMCMSYSGNCTISNYTAGRDSNRGGCVQSCRFEYKLHPAEHSETPLPEEVTLFSSKDLNGLMLLPQFVQAGISSVKIEGRMKSNLFLATAVKAYRQGLEAIRRNQAANLAEIESELHKVTHRQYTQASLLQPAGTDSVYNGSRMGMENSSYLYAGSVMEVRHDDSMLILSQNGWKNGTRLEILPFQQPVVEVDTTQSQDLFGLPLQEVKPQRLVRLPYVPGVEPMNQVRMLAG